MNIPYWIGYSISAVVGKLFFGFRAYHKERIPRKGPCLLAMNHQSYFDPPLAGVSAPRAIHFLARKSLFTRPVFGPIISLLNTIPVDQENPDMTALKAVIRLVRGGEAVLVFPEGTRTPDGNLQSAQPGVGLIVAKTMAPVVPMRIFGAYEAFPRNAKFPKPRRISIVVGEPIEFAREDLEKGAKETRDLYTEIGGTVMQRIAAIELPPDR